MATMMTKDWLVKHCRQRGLYQTPYLNDRLYLQCQAFCDVQNLEEYTGVKLLYLEENCLESMNGLQPLKQLQCLYLMKNFIKSIDHLEELEFLDTLDISQNYITCMENLSKCLNLRVLVVAHNQLESIESIAHLTSCPSIMILDLSHNKLKDGDGVLEIAVSLPQLAVLYLSGNPCISRMPHYRKNIIANLTNLSHLDDRPVFWDERLYAEAWLKGGQEAESAERDRVREIRAEEETKQFESMRQIREQNMAERLHIRRPNFLQFERSELGEDVSQTYAPQDDSGVMAENEVGVTPICTDDAICVTSPEEFDINEGPGYAFKRIKDGSSVDVWEEDQKVPDLALHFRQFDYPKHSGSSPSTDVASVVFDDFSKHDLVQNLNSNPLFNDSASDSVWPTANPSMFLGEVQSICVPKWVTSESRRDSYSAVHNNKLFSETALVDSSSSAQSDEPTTEPPLLVIDDQKREELGSPTLKGCGRNSLAALANSDLGTYTCRKSCSTIKHEDHFIVSSQTMNDVKEDST